MIDHAQRHGDLVAGRGGQVGGSSLLQAGPAGGRGQLGGAQIRTAVMEQHRPDPLDPALVLLPQIPVQLQNRPAVQHDRRRDPALRQVRLEQQITQQPGIGPVGLGPPLRPTLGRGVRRLSQMHPRPRGGEFLGHIPPPGTRLHRERDILTVGEPLGQPEPKTASIRRCQHSAPNLACLGVHIVEGDLSTMDVHSTYDRHRDLLMLPNVHVRTHSMTRTACAL
jgi:hypothetical protein